MTAVSQIHAHHGVTGIEEGEEHCQIGGGTGVGLYVGVLGTEQLLGALTGDVFHHVHGIAAAVVALARIALGVLVGEDGAGGKQSSLGNDVLGGDQFNVVGLPLELFLAGGIYFGIKLGEFIKKHRLLLMGDFCGRRGKDQLNRRSFFPRLIP